MNVVFLDYDGVVNTPKWHRNSADTKFICTFNFPSDNRVNDEQAVQWLSEFCEKFDYKIVVTSTWRNYKNYKECLINAGLRDGIEIIGKTESLYRCYCQRGEEVKQYLRAHKEIKNYVIIDDEIGDFQDDQFERIVKCDTMIGFKAHEYDWAANIHEKFKYEEICV